MRAFLSAIVVAIVLAVIGAFALDTVQKSASVAYSTQSVRL